jgi:hypothetical protein
MDVLGVYSHSVMVRIGGKAFRLFLLAFADVLIGGQALEAFESLGDVMGGVPRLPGKCRALRGRPPRTAEKRALLVLSP